MLKGSPTVVAAPDGQVYVNSTGNAGMATEQTGDVLTGMISSFVAQKPGDPLSATIAAVYFCTAWRVTSRHQSWALAQ